MEGKLMNVPALLQLNPRSPDETRKVKRRRRDVMNAEEIKQLVNAVESEKSLGVFCGIYITHPLLFTHKVCLAKNITNSLMQCSYKKLRGFLDNVEQAGVKNGLEEFGGIKNLLTIKNDRVIKSPLRDSSSLALQREKTMLSLQFEYRTIIQAMYTADPAPREDCVMECQVNCLFNYLCRFDPRSNSLINLVNYWANLNAIDICGKGDPENLLELPSHYTVKWLVMFFLCYKKYVPTVREIIERSPDTNLLIDEVTGTSIGFHSDPTFVEAWKYEKGTSEGLKDELSEMFIISLLQLLGKFFWFCGSCLGGKTEKVASIPNAKLISIGKLLDPSIVPYKVKGVYKIKAEDVDKLRNAVEKEKLAEDFCGFYMTHPFLFSDKICFAKNIRTIFKYCAAGGEKVLDFLRNHETGEQVCELKNVLTVSK